MALKHGLDAYLVQIGRSAVPTPAEERHLAGCARLGREAQLRLAAGAGRPGDEAKACAGKQAHTELFSRNLRLVVSVARRYPVSGRVDLCDLIQEGNIALDHAIAKFDERMGFKFSTYAVKWIRQAMSRALDKHTSAAKLPIETVRLVRMALRDTAGDVDALSLELHQASLAWQGTSLDAPTGGESKQIPLVDLLPAEDDESLEDSVVERLWREEFLYSFLHSLDPTSRLALTRRFGLDGEQPTSIVSIAKELGMRAERARQLILSALATAAQFEVNDTELGPRFNSAAL